MLMFDNHSIRYYADVDYSVELCKAVHLQALLDRGTYLPRARGWLRSDQGGDWGDNRRGRALVHTLASPTIPGTQVRRLRPI